MRAAPAVVVDVKPSAHWRATLLVLAGAACASTAVWAWQRGGPAAALVFAMVAALAVTVLRSAWRMPVQRLRWDGQGWWLAVAVPATETPGRLHVALDLGAWLLLRFQPAPDAGARRARWLPLQRRGLEADWHALRCALYSPRPAAPAPAGTEPSA